MRQHAHLTQRYCATCGAGPYTNYGIKRHRRSKQCAYNVRRREMEDAGKVTVGHAWRALKRAGLYERIDGSGRFGTSRVSWAPAWAVRICDAMRDNRARVCVVLRRQQLTALVLRLAKHEEKLQRALVAAHRLGGDDAVRKVVEQVVQNP